MACHYISDTPIGQALMLQDFRVDLALIAAFLTIVGYSINDTIVIFDRVRENRGRLSTVSSGLVNKSINETLSRTIITSLTTFMAVMVLYIAGGDGIHGFAFALVIGVLSGTYSTIAIATPMILHPRAMWTVSIVIATLAALGVAAATIPMDYGMRYICFAVVAVAALYGLFRQWAAPRMATA
jgi:SecD/SecF fusion protein